MRATCLSAEPFFLFLFFFSQFVVSLDKTSSLQLQSAGLAHPPLRLRIQFFPALCEFSLFCVGRIYNKLPEVAKKKEEEKKRAESQTNRLRAEVFKKVDVH